MSRLITLARCAVVAGYAGMAALLAAGGLTELDLWALTVAAAFCVAYILTADWIASGRRK